MRSVTDVQEVGMAGSLDDRVALVTGGASGIGRATALALARAGARLVVADVAVEGGEATADMIRAAGGEASFVRADVAQAASVEALIAAAVARYGRLDCAHNNAGVLSGVRGPIADVPEEQWDRVMAINLKGVWLCMKYEIPQMLRQGGGVIVNTASIAGLVGRANGGVYSASKHGVVGLTRSAALDYAQAGIRINAVCPGAIRTPMTEAGLSDPERFARVVAGEPMGRIGSPDEVASAVVWLCTDEASFVTGHAMVIDGAYTAQ